MAKGGRHADSDVVILEKPKPYNIITTLATPAVDEYKSYALNNIGEISEERLLTLIPVNTSQD
tara:strand:+ start:115 stop:303 length:189 start_codon:yes stop_codon:yes gene_type:complete